MSSEDDNVVDLEFFLGDEIYLMNNIKLNEG